MEAAKLKSLNLCVLPAKTAQTIYMRDNKRGTGTKVVHGNNTHKGQTKGTKDKETRTKVAHSNRRTIEQWKNRQKGERQRKREQGKCS
jgi:hypothetical protein